MANPLRDFSWISIYPPAPFPGIKDMGTGDIPAGILPIAPFRLRLQKKTVCCMTMVVKWDTDSEKRERFAELLSPVRKHLYNYIHKSLRFSPEADDIYQDTMLKAFTYLHAFDSRRSFKTWIFTIAHNLIKDHFRNSLPTTELNTDISAAHGGRRIDRRVTEIYDAVGHLKPLHREVFFLYYYNGFKVHEIARITAKSPASVKFTLNNARQRIRKILEVEP